MKPSLASVAAMSEAPDADDAAPADGEGYATALAELSDVLNVPEDRMGELADALEAFIRSCK